MKTNDGTEGQDRKSYSDDQDRKTYEVTPSKAALRAANAYLNDVCCPADKMWEAAESLAAIIDRETGLTEILGALKGNPGEHPGGDVTCFWCKRPITDGREESGASELDWMDEGDFGCEGSPLTDEEGVGNHQTLEQVGAELRLLNEARALLEKYGA